MMAGETFEEKTLFMLGQLDAKVDILVKNQTTMDKRVSAVERCQASMLGAAAVTGAVFSGLWEWFRRG